MWLVKAKKMGGYTRGEGEESRQTNLPDATGKKKELHTNTRATIEVLRVFFCQVFVFLVGVGGGSKMSC
jgi:hypothetical protein